MKRITTTDITKQLTRHSAKTFLALTFVSTFSAQAHFPLMECWLDNQHVVCEAGYSDGSKATDYAVQMFDYDDNLIAKQITDKRSIVEFKHPQTDFYIVFDSGHEYPVEVDIVEIKAR